MATLIFTGVCCVDCALIIANDDDSGIDSPTEHRERMARELRENDWSDAMLIVGDSEPTQEFSRRWCDTCGSTLAGMRLGVAVIR